MLRIATIRIYRSATCIKLGLAHSCAALLFINAQAKAIIVASQGAEVIHWVPLCIFLCNAYTGLKLMMDQLNIVLSVCNLS